MPSILVIGGLVFLLLPFLKKTGGAVEIETSNKGLAAVIGAILLASGIGLYLLPTPSTNPNTSSEMSEPAVAATRPSETQLSIVPTATSKPLSTHSVPCQIELLGEWLYQQPRAPMPTPAGPNQVIFAHGDINNSGTCHVKEFGPGEPVQGLGLGSFKLCLITGSPECIRDYETQLQQGAAAHAGTSCPYLP